MLTRVAGTLALVFLLVTTGCESAASRLNHEGMDAYRAGQYSQARGYFTVAIEKDPKLGDYYFNRGMCEQALGNLDRALADYGIATKLTPRITDAYQAMASCYLEKEKPDEALKALELGTLANPGNADTFLNVGKFYFERSDMDGTRLWYAKAAAAEPASAKAHKEYGLLLAMLGDKEKAVAELRKSLEIEPAQPDVSAKLTELAPSGPQLPSPKPRP